MVVSYQSSTFDKQMCTSTYIPLPPNHFDGEFYEKMKYIFHENDIRKKK